MVKLLNFVSNILTIIGLFLLIIAILCMFNGRIVELIYCVVIGITFLLISLGISITKSILVNQEKIISELQKLNEKK